MASGGILPERPNRAAEWIKPPEEELGLKRFVETVRERIALVIIATLVTTAVAVAYVATADKTYEAKADLLITPVASDTLPSLPLIRQSSDPTRDVETASLLVTNTDVAKRVQTDLGLSTSPQDLLQQVKAEPVAQSNIVAVTAQDHSKTRARDIANSFANMAVAEQTDKLHAQIESQITGLQAQVQSSRSPTLSARLSQLQALRTGSDPTIQVETLADLPQSPAKPRPLLTVSGGLLAGLVIGIAAAFAAQILDPTLRREEQLRRRYRLPILARIPRESPRPSESLEAILARIPRESSRQSEPPGGRQISAPAAEAYRILRANLDPPGARAEGTRALLVTGASPSEGKTTTAVNLAASLALAGRRVILIEADLHRPALAPALGLEDVKSGVVSVLDENTSLSEALIPSPTYGKNLQALAADYSGGWIPELFSTPASRQLIDDARKLADFVIVDSPPLTEVVDALPLARKCDQVLIVARLGKTRLDRLNRLAELLANNEITPTGFVVVGAPRPGRSDYRYYSGDGEGRGGGRSLMGAGRGT